MFRSSWIWSLGTSDLVQLFFCRINIRNMIGDPIYVVYILLIYDLLWIISPITVISKSGINLFWDDFPHWPSLVMSVSTFARMCPNFSWVILSDITTSTSCGCILTTRATWVNQLNHYIFISLTWNVIDGVRFMVMSRNKTHDYCTLIVKFHHLPPEGSNTSRILDAQIPIIPHPKKTDSNLRVLTLKWNHLENPMCSWLNH
jgi:hypothetical protein